jgi:hypothetical protein
MKKELSYLFLGLTLMSSIVVADDPHAYFIKNLAEGKDGKRGVFSTGTASGANLPNIGYGEVQKLQESDFPIKINPGSPFTIPPGGLPLSKGCYLIITDPGKPPIGELMAAPTPCGPKAPLQPLHPAVPVVKYFVTNNTQGLITVTTAKKRDLSMPPNTWSTPFTKDDFPLNVISGDPAMTTTGLKIEDSKSCYRILPGQEIPGLPQQLLAFPITLETCGKIAPH